MKMLRDTWIIFLRQFESTIRNAAWVLSALAQPVVFLVLFGPLLEPLAGGGLLGTTNAFNFFVPGLLLQIALFGASFAGFALIFEMKAGITERMRVTPVSRPALLLGRALNQVVITVAQGIVLVVVAIPFGLQLPVAGLLPAFFLVSLIALFVSSISYALALVLRDEDSFGPILNTATFPLLLLSGILLPLNLGPQWLQTIAAVNPFTYAVDGARALFLDNLGATSVSVSLVIFGILAIVGVVIGARAFGRATA